MKRQMKAKTLNSVERISKIKSEIAAMECNRSVAAAILQKGVATGRRRAPDKDVSSLLSKWAEL